MTKNEKELLFLIIQMKKLIISSSQDLQEQMMILVIMFILHLHPITSQKWDDGTWPPKAKNAIRFVSRLQGIETEHQMQFLIHFQVWIDSWRLDSSTNFIIWSRKNWKTENDYVKRDGQKLEQDVINSLINSWTKKLTRKTVWQWEHRLSR